MFRLINPTDPISQIEWTKQNAVKGIFPKPVTDRSGSANPAIQPDTISVFAKFNNENSFFGLTSYLAYAEKQLAYSYQCVLKANAQTTNKLEFPWRAIDDSSVEAVGFIPTPFEFQIDKTKILDLLTGHTLYNDSSIAIRELVQNSIDAVRLQSKIKNQDSDVFGKIKIAWNSADRTLTVLDNGTGMSQEIIERHLLNVGSSRYQDVQFKEKHPDFSPISRFGIGILSTFMVADNVQIITFDESEESKQEGREISLRSVHGKYLIRLLNKTTSQEFKEIGPHGTKIILKMRGSSKPVDVLQTLERWIMFPRCIVTATIDGEPEVPIGHSSPKKALESYISKANVGINKSLVEVQERNIGGLTLAYATIYNSHFRNRNFLRHSDEAARRVDAPFAPIGTCIEGIRVEFISPGFSDRSLLSVVDCTGLDAPKTNVARSALESENDYKSLSGTIFDLYLAEVQCEIDRLQKVEGYSLTYAIEEFPFIAGPLYLSARENLADRLRSYEKFPMFMLEDGAGRRAVSTRELIELGGFWTVQSTTMNSLISLLRDTPANITCKQVAEFSKFKGAALPSGNLVTSSFFSSVPSQLVSHNFEICEIRASDSDRRLDTRWQLLDPDNPIWISTSDIERDAPKELREEFSHYRRIREERSRRRGVDSGLEIATRSFAIDGLKDFVGVATMTSSCLLPGNSITDFLLELDPKNKIENCIPFLIYVDSLAGCFDMKQGYEAVTTREIEFALKELTGRFEGHTSLDPVGFLTAVSGCDGRLRAFNPWSWHRNEGDNY